MHSNSTGQRTSRSSTMDDGTEVEIVFTCCQCEVEVNAFTPIDWKIYRRRKPQTVRVLCPECGEEHFATIENE